MLKLLTAILVAFALLVAVMPSTVLAETTAEQNQTLELDCDVASGAYGQNTTTNCHAKGDQSQKLGIVLSARALHGGHKPVDTGLDSLSGLTAAGILTIGTTAGYLRLKSRNS